MKIDRLVLGAYETNCYVVRSDESAAECVLIDTGLDAEELVDFLQRQAVEPVAVILTHGHADHIAGLEPVRKAFTGVRVYIHEQDAEALTNAEKNLSQLAGVDIEMEPPDEHVKDGDVIEQANLKFEVLHTPGHTPGGICLYCREQGVLFSGDTLFADSIGRADFPGGNGQQLISSIKDKLLHLPEDTQVYTGHGPQTTIGREKKYNPFF